MEKDKLIFPELSYQIVGCLFNVFNELGPNRLEKFYQRAFNQEFIRQGIKFCEQVKSDVLFKGEVIGKTYLDFLVEDRIVLELKVGTYLKKEGFEQILEYLKNNDLRLGIIATFGKHGVKYYRVLN